MRQITQLEEKKLFSKQKVAASDELKCAAIDWKIESENIMKTDLKSNMGVAEMSLDQVVNNAALGTMQGNVPIILYNKLTTRLCNVWKR
jgi:hypothetical protein